MEILHGVIEEEYTTDHTGDEETCLISPLLSTPLTPEERGQLWRPSERLIDINRDDFCAVFSVDVNIYQECSDTCDVLESLKEKQTDLSSLPHMMCGNCDSVPASLRCEQCDNADSYFCESCWGVHILVKPYRHHTCTPYNPNAERLHPCFPFFHKFFAIMEACIASEQDFVHVMQMLSVILQDFRYISMPPVREFMESAAVSSFVASLDGVKTVCELHLQSLKDLRVSHWKRSLNTHASFHMDEALPDILSAHTAFITTIRKFCPSFRVFRGCVGSLPRVLELLSSLVRDQPEFGEHVLSVEGRVGESLMSLLSRPAKRLPWYLLNCKQIYECVGGALRLVDSDYVEVFESTYQLARKLFMDLSKCLLGCYHAIREDQHRKHLHDLYDQLVRGNLGHQVPALASSGRSILRKGFLKRHVKNGKGCAGAVRRVHVYLMSDILVATSEVQVRVPISDDSAARSLNSRKDRFIADPTPPVVKTRRPFQTPPQHPPPEPNSPQERELAPGTLRLEFTLPLNKGSDTVCLPLPSLCSDNDSSWFVVVSPNTAVYLCAGSVHERDEWVESINQVLSVNLADKDTYRVKNQLALVNTLIGEIFTRLNQQATVAGGMKCPPTYALNHSKNSGKHERTMGLLMRRNVFLTQPNWWGLYELLEAIVDEEQLKKSIDSSGTQATDSVEDNTDTVSVGSSNSPVSHLRLVIDQHAQEFSESLLSRCATRSSKEAVLAALDNNSSTWLSSVTSDPHMQHLIAVDWFFERPAGSGRRAGDTQRRWGVNNGRPHILQVFLLSHVLLAMRLCPSPEGEKEYQLTYAFHIEMRNLECSHYSWDSAGGGGSSNNCTTTSDLQQSCAILLTDSSLSSAVRGGISTLLGQSTSPHNRVIYAPTMDRKCLWVDFISECIRVFRSCDGNSSSHRLQRLREEAPNLRRLDTKGSLYGVWSTEK